MLILAAASGIMAILLLAQVGSSVVQPPPVVLAGEPDAGALDAAVDSDVDAAIDADTTPPAPPPWRVSALAKDPTIELIDGAMAKRTLLNALTSSGIAAPAALRLVHAFDGIRTFDDSGQKDTFVVAREKATQRIVAFEYSASPFDVWQARASDDADAGTYEAKKLDLHLEKKHVAVGVAVGDDLRASIVQAGLDDDMLPLLDDALEGHAELSDLRPGARLRILAVEDRADGAFVRYEALEAVEYTPAFASNDTKPLRVYYFAKAPTTTWLARSAKQHESAKTPSFFYDS